MNTYEPNIILRAVNTGNPAGLNLTGAESTSGRAARGPRRDSSRLGMTRFSQCAVGVDAVSDGRSSPLAVPRYGVTVVPMCWLAPPVSGNSRPAMAFGPTNGTASCPRPASCQTVMSMCAIDMNPSPPGPEIVPMR